jgi:hypothetical protein
MVASLVTGAAWLLFAVIVFRFDYGSVQAIAVLFGVVVLAAAASTLPPRSHCPTRSVPAG